MVQQEVGALAMNLLMDEDMSAILDDLMGWILVNCHSFEQDIVFLGIKNNLIKKKLNNWK